MFAGNGESVLPRTASYAFSCSAKAAGFLKKRNGFCTSQTMSEAEAALSWRAVVSETETSQVVVASRRMKISRTFHPAPLYLIFQRDGAKKFACVNRGKLPCRL